MFRLSDPFLLWPNEDDPEVQELAHRNWLKVFAEWNPATESRAAAKARLEAGFRLEVEAFLNRAEHAAIAAGWSRTPRKRARTRRADPNLHFEWLARFQVQGWSYGAIANHYDVSRDTVEGVIPKLAGEIGLSRRTLPSPQ